MTNETKPTERIVEEDNVVSNGKHTLSGIGTTTIPDDWDYGTINVNLFCIDGKTYGVFIDPNDGWRSYGVIKECPTMKCEYTFPPQEVIVTNKVIEGNEEYFAEDKHLLVITDAVNGKEVLTVGTDYADNWYPYAIFHYVPENLNINQDK